MGRTDSDSADKTWTIERGDPTDYVAGLQPLETSEATGSSKEGFEWEKCFYIMSHEIT